jgi:hypothetical protein
MKFNKIYLAIISILGILLLYSYYFFIKQQKSNSDRLWGRIKGTGDLQKYYEISIVLAAIGFLVMMFYLLVGDSFTESDIKHIFISSLIIIIVSMFWMPLSLYYIHHHNIWLKYLIVMVLLIIAVSSYYLMLRLYWTNDKQNHIIRLLSILGMVFFFIHTFILDSIIWPKYFF